MEVLPLLEKVKFLKQALNLNAKQIAFLIKVNSIDSIAGADSVESMRLNQLFRAVKKIVMDKPDYSAKEISFILRRTTIALKKEKFNIEISVLAFIRSFPNNQDLSAHLDKILAEYHRP